MRSLIYLFALALAMGCSKDADPYQKEYEFIDEYTVTITVGGVVGIVERTFAIGEAFRGKDEGIATITLRISEHTKRNEDCPNPWCYQEFLDVPRAYLKAKI
ncbi:MAG: hypothetical protein WBM83_09320 [Flavobacteriaceae bacterium]